MFPRINSALLLSSPVPQTVTLTDEEEEKMQERLKDIDLQVKALTKNRGPCTIGHTPYTAYTIHRPHTPYAIHHIPYTIYTIHHTQTIRHTPYTIFHTSYTINLM
jgi:hypothetical protein